MPHRRPLVPGRILAPALIAAAVLAAPLPARADATNWATAQATELTRQAVEHASHGDRDTAVRRYREAISFDATFGPAYLGLGAIHEAAGDPIEAERTYALGLEHVGGFADGHLARGRLRKKLRRTGDAIADFEAASAIRPDDLGVLRELAAAYVSASALPAALATARRIAVLAAVQGDAQAAAEARIQIVALSILVGEVDPIAAGASGRGPVRRAIALAARRR